MVRKIKENASQYKDYYIIADPAGDGYNVYSKDRELEDEGFGTLADAKKFIDTLTESVLSIPDLKAFYNTSDSIDRDKYPNFFAWYDDMVKSGKFRLGTKLFGESEVTNEKALTFDEFQAFAMKHYNSGGDSVVECWDEQAFDEYVKEFGPITKKDALSIFHMYNSVYGDIRGYASLDESIDWESKINAFAISNLGGIPRDIIPYRNGTYEVDYGEDSYTVYIDDNGNVVLNESKSIKEDALDDSGVATAHVSTLSERMPNSKFYTDSNKFILGKDLPDYFDTDEIISYSQFTDENNIRVTNSYKIIDRTRTNESKPVKESVSEATVTRYVVEYYTDDDETRNYEYVYADSVADARKFVKDKYYDAVITACIPEQVPANYKKWDNADKAESTNEGYRYKGVDKTSSTLTMDDLNALEANPGEVYNFNSYDIFYGENKDHFPFKPCYYVTFRPSNYTSIMTDKERCLNYLNTYYKAKTTEDDKPLTEGKLYGTYDKTALETDLLALADVDKVDWDLSAYNELGEIIVLTHRAFEDSVDLSTYYMKRTELLREILKVFKKHNLKLEDPIEDQGTWWYFVLSEATPEVTDTPVFEHMVVEFFETSDPLTDGIMDKTKGVKYTDPKVLSDILVRADEAFKSQKDNIGYNKVYFDNYIRYQGKLYKFHAGRVDLGDGAAQVTIPDTYIKDVTDYFLDELKAGNDKIPVVEE